MLTAQIRYFLEDGEFFIWYRFIIIIFTDAAPTVCVVPQCLNTCSGAYKKDKEGCETCECADGKIDT